MPPAPGNVGAPPEVPDGRGQVVLAGRLGTHGRDAGERGRAQTLGVGPADLVSAREGLEA